MGMIPVHIRNLVKTFGPTTAVDNVTLDVPAGSLFFLLGPSGCGKTTLLRMLAGFTEPTAGTISFGEKDITHLPANKRQAGMVFQGYALWPHMTVWQNVEFGLKVRKISGSEKLRRVDEALDRVQMLSLAKRKPNELSGGQQQRVALARALVIEPSVLLLDEPLSNLDAKLRLEMRGQIRDICRAAQITTIYVTHDQKEAIALADQIAVMNDGRVVQIGAPQTLYQHPTRRFVAEFLGETNLISATVAGKENGVVLLDSSAGQLRSENFPADIPEKGNVTCSLRPEAISFVRGAPEARMNVCRAQRRSYIYQGDSAQHHLQIGPDLLLKVLHRNPRDEESALDEQVQIQFDPRDVVILED